MTGNPLHSVSVAAVTFNDAGHVLVVKRRDNGDWEIPGGVLEHGETFEEGVVREVLEETGIQVRVDRLVGVYKNLRRFVVALVYRCSLHGGSPRSSPETVASEWLTVEEAVRRMKPAFAVRVQDAFRCDSAGPASRAHDGVELVSTDSRSTQER